MNVAAALGMSGPGVWVPGERPENWRQMILYLFPNGDMPITGIMSRLKSERVNDYKFNWFDEKISVRGSDIATNTGGNVTIATDADLGSRYNPGSTGAALSAGGVLYVKVNSLFINEVRTGMTVDIRKYRDFNSHGFGQVVQRYPNGDNSVIAVRLLIDDPGKTTLANHLGGADRVEIIGDANPQGGAMPDAVNYKPTRRDNLTQIFKTPLLVSRTAAQTNLRTGPEYQRRKMEALRYHGISLEDSFLWGHMSEVTGENGQPQTTTQGIYWYIKEGAADNVRNFNDAATNAVWKTHGEDWLEESFRQVFKYGGNTRLMVAGSGAIGGIQQLVKMSGTMNIYPGEKSYGINVRRWQVHNGEIMILQHPRMSQNPRLTNCAFILDTAEMRFRHMQDTMFKDDDMKNGLASIDGRAEHYLTEAGLELHHPEKFMFLYNMGLDEA